MSFMIAKWRTQDAQDLLLGYAGRPVGHDQADQVKANVEPTGKEAYDGSTDEGADDLVRGEAAFDHLFLQGRLVLGRGIAGKVEVVS